jgi:hypothetical protein
MKLSEAMRIGAAQYPPCDGVFFKMDEDGNCLGCCAIGSIMLGVGMKPHVIDHETTDEAFEFVEDKTDINLGGNYDLYINATYEKLSQLNRSVARKELEGHRPSFYELLYMANDFPPPLEKDKRLYIADWLESEGL